MALHVIFDFKVLKIRQNKSNALILISELTKSNEIISAKLIYPAQLNVVLCLNNDSLLCSPQMRLGLNIFSEH